ncbi:serine/threonine-protein kinase [Aerolutibacter ruishenii]|uniref:Serine/threonine-protein kinase n=1 Tax=Aerolutibacter ruishenii TaxID=686800 RepID=A0A562M0F7_9GAMM|nr:serine/threonine-protein kinase [Lysobacter ruishenii]TWI13360.1 serine/threonine-protein kinase [Lysobacter ruishenii]
MDTERWQRLSPLLDALLELEPDARARRLDALRTEDAGLADELGSLIDLDENHADFLAEPALNLPTGPAPGALIGPYRLERLLGEGGMGQVWLAARADGLYQRRVALKLLRPGLADTNLRVRFTREREILARLTHPHIARLLDAGISQDNLPYLALEYVDGVPITDWCSEQHTPLDLRLQMFHQICDAVSHAHANLIVHRDLKPSNILVTPAGDVRLLDFGIAKLLDHDAPLVERTRTGVRAFTLHYAAPEQVRGEPVSTMTDVYSLGVLLYELFTDSKPYRPPRKSDAAWEEAILSADPLRPSQALLRAAELHPGDAHGLRRRARTLVGDLDNIVLKALAKQPEQRYASVEALALDLRRHQLGRPVAARPDSVGYRLRKYLHRHRWALATGSLVAAVLVAALGLVAWQAREAVREASRAQAIQDFMISVFETASAGESGQPLDVRGLLDASLQRGQRELARQPRARAELIGLVARLRIGLGDYDEARALLERQAAILEASDDIPDSLRLESVTQRGRVLRLQDKPRECIDLMQPALASARRQQAQLPPQVAEFYSQLGRCRRENGERRGARQLFERALAIRRDGNGDRIGEVANLMDLANLHADAGEIGSALRQLDEAREQLRAEAGSRHPLLVGIGRSLGSLHRARGDFEGARREVAGALAVSLATSGSDHPASIATQLQLAGLEMDTGHFREAREALDTVYRHLEARLGSNHPDTIRSLVGRGRAERELGDIVRAMDTLLQAAAAARRVDDPTLRSEVLIVQGAVLRDAGRAAEALPLLQEVVRLRREREGDGHFATGAALLELGLAQQSLGDAHGASTSLRNAAAMTRRALGAGHPDARNAAAASARLRAQAGDAGARHELENLARRQGARPDATLASVRAGAYLAEAGCPHSPAAATAALAALQAPLAKWQPEGGVLTREVTAIDAACRHDPP